MLQWLLLVLDVIILIAAVWVIFESAIVMSRARKSPPELDEDAMEGAAPGKRSSR